jgi:hypothetical protein
MNRSNSFGIRQGESSGQRHRREPWIIRQFPTGLLRNAQADFLQWSATELPKAVDIKARRIDMDSARQAQQNRPQSPNRGWRQSDEFVVAIRSLAFMQTTADQIVLACAIERFRNDHGALPKTLQELTPKYISAIPHDVFTGKPLAYKMSSDSHYILYSIGVDGVDDNGRPAQIHGSWTIWQGEPTGDWVWNSQATDAPPPKLRAVRRK